jgi:methionyl-tRNA synthetase
VLCMKKSFFLSTPIFYPNAKLHMGHAYTTTLADSIVRYQRLMGNDTYFLTGSDENTQKMVDAARAAGQTPLDFLHDIINKFDGLFRELDISFDQFIRTTDQEKHWKGAQALWKRLEASGDIYQKEYEGLYCVGHEAFITEKDLVDGKCPDHGTEPQFLKETNYFFRLSKYTAAIKAKIESDELRVVPASRKNEILALLNEGLEDVSFSRPRKPDWPDSLGIPVPGDPTQVMYVWCDALSNYITALGFGRDDDSLYQKFWPGMHVIGKDILRFHAAIWPGMLLSAGLPLPRTLLVHGFITSGGKKMSKSLGNVIDPEELIEAYGAEAVRYYLVRHITPYDDGDITRESFKDAYNADLANGLGNLAARIMTLAEKNLAAPIERPETIGFPKEYTDAFELFRPDLAAAYVWQRISALDQRIAETEPFKVVKTDPEKGNTMIADMARELYAIAGMIAPIMPMTSHTIKQAILANKKPENLFARKD